MRAEIASQTGVAIAIRSVPAIGYGFAGEIALVDSALIASDVARCMDEYGQLPLLQGRAAGWNKLASRFIMRVAQRHRRNSASRPEAGLDGHLLEGINLPPIRFFVFIAVSLLVFIVILRWTLRARTVAPAASLTGGVAFIIVVGGMCFAKFAATAGLPWPLYYGVPAAVTLALPPLAFRMQRSEFAWYVLSAFASSPLIHVAFSFFAGWHEYMPFWHIPSLWDLGS